MSDNKLLAENTIRRFMKLANVDTMTDNFVNEKYGKMGKREELEEDNEEINEEEEVELEENLEDLEEQEEPEEDADEEVELDAEMGDMDLEMDAEAPAEPVADEKKEEEFKGQYYTAPPPAKSEAEKEAARKKILEEADELDMFGDGGDFAGAEDSDEEEPEANAHLKNDPYATAASRVEASASKD